MTTFAPYGPWASDLGAKYATSGLPLVLVTGAPSQGQYSAASGVYSFAAADQNAGVSISYGYIPQDIVQAALELTAERFRAAERVGLRSKSVGGQETIAYDMSAVSAPIMALLQPYRRVGL